MNVLHRMAINSEVDQDVEARFSFAWSEYREIIPLHQKQFLGWIQPMTLSFFAGKRFLDAGCGIGRNSLWPLKAGAASAYLLDCGQATVEVARKNLKDFGNCEVVRQSIYDLSFDREFDIVMSIGVLHHLRDPRQALEKLVRALKPKGTLILWVYAHEGNERYLRWINPLRQHLTSKLPLWMTLILAKALTVLLKIYVAFPRKQEYLRLLGERSFRHVEAMVFDQLLPKISNYWTRDELLALIEGLPIRIVHLTHAHGMSWTLIAEKSAVDFA